MAARKSALLRQIYTLVKKNWTLLIVRHFTSTLYSALILPVVLTVYLGTGQNLNDPLTKYGIAEPRPVRSLQEGLAGADSSRDKVVFVNNGHSGGEIDQVISSLSDTVSAAGKVAKTVFSTADLALECSASFRGTTSCYGAVVFNASPREGEGGLWNYTLRADAALGINIRVDKSDNDPQVYALPLQRAVDSAIAQVSSTDSNPLPSNATQEWAFTSETEDERSARIRRNYQDTFYNYLGVAFILALIGVSYHLPGNMATEREKGISQLIDAMMATQHDWEPQVARMFSTQCTFALVYLPGWIIASIIARFMIWKETSVGIVLGFFLLGGLALTSQAIMGATFFKRAQLSGVANALVYLLLGVLAQALPDPSTATVAVLSLLFTPCSFIFIIRYISRFEGKGQPMDLARAPPNSASTLPGIVIWVFLIVQILVYPLIAAILERWIHGVASKSRRIYKDGCIGAEPQAAVRLEGLTKVYGPSLLRNIFSFVSKPRPPTVAVNNLSLTAGKGQIVALLGANGSGKSTVLDAIAGISRVNQGSISIDASGGIGIAPQKNVMWDELTVFEHIKIFNELKSPHERASEVEMNRLIGAVDLKLKKKALAKTLSGGQKRKLQLAMMLTGGSTICCVDEVSSGIDPLSRRKIWDILLSERGKRTIILTTHFLDEADLLADHIAILSMGTLRAEGSPVALKEALGAGHRIHVLDAKNAAAPEVPGVARKDLPNSIIYTAPTSSLAADVIRALEHDSLSYRLSTPTIEDVFLQVAEEAKTEIEQSSAPAHKASNKAGPQDPEKPPDKAGKPSLELLSGRRTGLLRQTAVLILKRCTLFKTNWIPYVVAFLVPIVAAALAQILVRGDQAIGCSPADQDRVEGTEYYDGFFKDAVIVGGPASQFTGSSFTDLLGRVIPNATDSNGSSEVSNITFDVVSSFADLRGYVEEHRKQIHPGGWWFGDLNTPATIFYRADTASIYTAIMAQNLINNIRTNISIAVAYAHFDNPAPGSMGNALQLAIYFTIAAVITPAFFALHPNLERRTNVRSLQYSSGVGSLSLWMSHTVFDFTIFSVSLIVAAIIFTTSSSIWYNPGYLFPVFLLFGLAAILLSYIFSLFFGSQVSTFAAMMAYNGVGSAIYLLSFLFIIALSPGTVADRNIRLAHYIISVFFPGASLCRALFIGLNVFSASCSGHELEANPDAISAFGGPMLYLSIQSVFLFGILLYHDSGNKIPSFLKGKKTPQSQEGRGVDQELAEGLDRSQLLGDDNGLQVKHLTKSFANFKAVQDVTFAVPHGEVFALLGPNGAGKSTIISLIRGDIQPNRYGGDVFIEKISVAGNRALARVNLGVCPQFDALDSMTVVEHLRHYARIRGISDVEHQVRAVVQAVGLNRFTETMAQHLSGGNKRKLSLGIALTGNPSVILLDEPSSGLDAAAKRVMWRTLQTIAAGRSILLTTHSMEEADALANRAGILAQRMLAVGDVQQLLERFGDSLYVHLISRTAPHSTPLEMDRIRGWVVDSFPGAQIEPDTYHGQMRFSVPASVVLEHSRRVRAAHPKDSQEMRGSSAIGHLILMLEDNKESLGIDHFSVSPTTLSDVFLAIVGQHNVQEENHAPTSTRPAWLRLLLGMYLCYWK